MQSVGSVSLVSILEHHRSLVSTLERYRSLVSILERHRSLVNALVRHWLLVNCTRTDADTFSCNKQLARSSAILHIYSSIFLPSISTFKQFKKLVEKVQSNF